MWLQYDFGDGPVIDGTKTTLFCAWLAWSRFRVVLPIRDKTAPSVMAALDVTLRRLGGAPTYLLIENEKTVTVQGFMLRLDTTSKGWGLLLWPPAGTYSWPPVGTFSWPWTSTRPSHVEGLGALKGELVTCLRTGRALRVPRARNRQKAWGHVTSDVLISERPAEAEDRAVPGHWEGDLIIGLQRSAIGTLVERTTRFTMPVHLPREAGYGLIPRTKDGPRWLGTAR